LLPVSGIGLPLATTVIVNVAGTASAVAGALVAHGSARLAGKSDSGNGSVRNGPPVSK
jgi:hypothetical protein